MVCLHRAWVKTIDVVPLFVCLHRVGPQGRFARVSKAIDDALLAQGGAFPGVAVSIVQDGTVCYSYGAGVVKGVVGGGTMDDVMAKPEAVSKKIKSRRSHLSLTH